MNKAELESVNAYFNAMPYVADVDENWMPITEKGDDCDSYSTAKYNRLVEMGWPKSALRLATCWCENNLGYHAVLLADLDNETWVLDNRTAKLLHPENTGYEWHKLQIAGTKEWELA
jgi:predicted transglutaminase-like cysteine proteinase